MRKIWGSILFAVFLITGCEPILGESRIEAHVGGPDASGCAGVICDPDSVVADPCCTVAVLDREVTIHPSRYAVDSTVEVMRTAVGIAAAVGTVYWLDIPTEVGDRVKTLTFSHFGNSISDIGTAEVALVNADGTAVSLGLATVTDPAATWVRTVIDVTDTTIATGQSLLFYAWTNGPGIHLGNASATFAFH